MQHLRSFATVGFLAANYESPIAIQQLFASTNKLPFPGCDEDRARPFETGSGRTEAGAPKSSGSLFV